MSHSLSTIRPAAKCDLPAILDIEHSCRTVTWSAAAFSSELTADNAVNLVAQSENGTACGFVFAVLAADELEINTIAVHPDHRRRGVARCLLAAAADAARRRGAESVHLEVRSKNRVAFDLYVKLGFEIRWIRRKYYSDDGDDAIVMSRDIDLVLPDTIFE
ncbi:MAG TPA: ribosomal protein S18-alanine N-acetyltransferase [Chitinivibrionales bacterium]|nr:ribosomal protein S18-alanine N-acetyltransferase [Chitinivibrionales bacterium]